MGGLLLLVMVLMMVVVVAWLGLAVGLCSGQQEDSHEEVAARHLE